MRSSSSFLVPVASQTHGSSSLYHPVALVLCVARLRKLWEAHHHHPHHQRAHSQSPNTALRHVMGLCCLPAPGALPAPPGYTGRCNAHKVGVEDGIFSCVPTCCLLSRSRASNQPSPCHTAVREGRARVGWGWGRETAVPGYSHQKHKSAVLQSQGSGGQMSQCH